MAVVAEAESHLEGVDVESLVAIASTQGFESIYETLLQEPFEDMERRILVSSMVQDAVAKGFLKALEEESSNFLKQIRELQHTLKEKEDFILNLQDFIDRSIAEGTCKPEKEDETNAQFTESGIANEGNDVNHQIDDLTLTLNQMRQRALLLEEQLHGLEVREKMNGDRVNTFQEEISKLKHDNALLIAQNENLQKTLQIQSLEKDNLYGDVTEEEKLRYHIECDIFKLYMERQSNVQSEIDNQMVMNIIMEIQLQEELESMIVQLSVENWYKEITGMLLQEEEPKPVSKLNELPQEESTLQMPRDEIFDPSDEFISLQMQALELDVINVVVVQKYQELMNSHSDLNSQPCYHSDSLECTEQILPKNFEELEAQLESFLELEARRLERIKSGCSTSIARCEFKLETLMKSLADQVNEMRMKISFVQEAIKQQEWKHMVEDDILIVILLDSLSEMHKRLELEDISHHFRNIQARLNISCDDLTALDSTDISNSSDLIESILPAQDKDKMLLILKKVVWDLKKEKATSEQKLEEKTEELYSLKRQFWKEREFWVSKLSPSRIKELEGLPPQSSTFDLEEEFKKMVNVRLDSHASDLRKEWAAEKESLLQSISQKDMEIYNMANEISRLKDKESNLNKHLEKLVAHVAELTAMKDNISSEKLNQEFLFVKSRREWEDERKSLIEVLEEALNREQNHVIKETELLGRISEFETQLEGIKSTSLSQESFLKIKEEWQTEKEVLLKKLAEKTNANEKLIGELQDERLSMVKTKLLMEEKERALYLAIQERDEESKRRSRLEAEFDKHKNRMIIPPCSGQSNLSLAQQFNLSLKASNDFEQSVLRALQNKTRSLETLKEKCSFAKNHLKSSSTKEAQYKQKLAKELYNLQKAETEVDLLGDEVESLLMILEEVQSVFDLYAPFLQHYPRMMEVATLVKKEVQLRIDPKYGA